MPQTQSEPVRSLPQGVLLLGSAVIAFHLFTLVILAVAAPSGPWPVMGMVDMATGPQFANTISEATTNHYLRHLAMTHNYHFLTNRTVQSGIYFEVVLKDKNGDEVKRLKFPEENANFWVRHRQSLLAQGLEADQPVVRGGEKVVAAGEKAGKVEYWLNKNEVGKLANPIMKGDQMIRPALIPEARLKSFGAETGSQMHFVYVTLPADFDGEVPRDRPFMGRPGGWSVVLVKSYLRHLCDKHNAHTAELIRHSRPAVLPAYMFAQTEQADWFTETVAHFGDLQRDLDEVAK